LHPLGIIINELLTNIMKYAFNGGKDGKIIIEAHVISASLESASTENHVSIIVADNGSGMPQSVDFEHSTGFGLELVQTMTKQLAGSIRIERDKGTKIVLEFAI